MSKPKLLPKNNLAALVFLIFVLALGCSACSGPAVAKAQVSDPTNAGFQIVTFSTPEAEKTAEVETLVSQIKEKYPCVGETAVNQGIILRKISNNTVLVQMGGEQKRITLIGLSTKAISDSEISYDDVIGKDVVVMQGTTPFTSDNRELGYIFSQSEMLNKKVLDSGGIYEQPNASNSECNAFLIPAQNPKDRQ